MQLPLRGVMFGLLLSGGGCVSLPPATLRSAEYALPPVADAPLSRIALASTPPGGLAQSGFRLLLSGESAFNARIALTRRATRSLDAQYYGLADDDTGRGFLSELRDAAQRGVRMRLLVDDLHAGDMDRQLAGLAAYPNVQVRLFNPLSARGGDGGGQAAAVAA